MFLKNCDRCGEERLLILRNRAAILEISRHRQRTSAAQHDDGYKSRTS